MRSSTACLPQRIQPRSPIIAGTKRPLNAARNGEPLSFPCSRGIRAILGQLQIQTACSLMPTQGSKNPKATRRLAAILAADIAGYSALMGADEEATVRDLKTHQAVILPMIGEHGGRVIDTAGDGILAEFGSIVNAVECAIAIQTTMGGRNTQV